MSCMIQLFEETLSYTVYRILHTHLTSIFAYLAVQSFAPPSPFPRVKIVYSERTLREKNSYYHSLAWRI